MCFGRLFRMCVSGACFGCHFRMCVSDACFGSLFRMSVSGMCSDVCFGCLFREFASDACFGLLFRARVSDARFGSLFRGGAFGITVAGWVRAAVSCLFPVCFGPVSEGHDDDGTTSWINKIDFFVAATPEVTNLGAVCKSCFHLRQIGHINRPSWASTV